ncbi:MAG: response regulator transcription factor [Bdellovibrionota bacterium]
MRNSKMIHVIEDDADITKLLLFNLSMAGYQVSTSTDGEEALKFLEDQQVDIILLDLMLPKIDGIEVCKRLRAGSTNNKTPIIMLTAKGHENDIVLGLDSGADDYITKPFSPKVLIARIENALRHNISVEEKAGDILKRENIEIHLNKYEVKIDGSKTELTPSEFQILVLLAKKPGWVFTRTQIVDHIHGENYAVTTRAIDFQMVGLRKKLGSAGSLIETVRGIGYKFKVKQ